MRLRRVLVALHLGATKGKLYQAHKAHGIGYADMLYLSGITLDFGAAGHYMDLGCLATLALMAYPKGLIVCEMTSTCHFLLSLWEIIFPSAAATDVALPLRKPGLGYFDSQCGLCASEEAFCVHRPMGTM